MVCYLKLRREGESLWEFKNISAIIFFGMMCLLGWSASISTLFLVIYNKETQNPLLFCQVLQTECCPGNCPLVDGACPSSC